MHLVHRWGFEVTRYFLAAILSILLVSVSKADDLNCLSEKERVDAKLYAQLQSQAYAALDRRDKAFEQLNTRDKILARQQELRAFFVKQLGGFPERSPLNSKTVRTIEAKGYRIECVIFDSQPGHRITANLYLPDAANGPVPAVVVSSGHSRTAKGADYNQRFGVALASNGIAALCFDPIGQGERSQIINDQGVPDFNGTTTEHILVDVGSMLVGRDTARYRVWDAMRSIDYLQSRPEIDGKRIGMTGCSGGGTLTSYVMALDDRIACAAPACYLTTFRHLIQTIGPQDAEQNINGQLAFGMDHPDYLLMRAPRPTLICSTTGDFFPIAGAWETFRQAKRIYGQLGYPERVDLVEMEGKHGVKPQGLATIVHWMKRWLLHKDDPVPIVDYQLRTVKELQCTSTGQVLTSFDDEQSVFDLNASYASELAAKRTRIAKENSANAVRAMLRKQLGLSTDDEIAPPKFSDLGRLKREEYHIDKLVLRRAPDATLPGLTFHPPVPSDDAYLYLHDAGKIGDTEKGGAVESLVENGFAVVTIDLSGQGETAAGKRDELLSDWKTFYLSYLLGKPLLGRRVEDALAAADFVAYYQKDREHPRKVHLVGAGQAGIVALHAAALHPELFASVTLKETPRSWLQLTAKSVPKGQLDSIVPGALKVYDLPDLVRLAGEKKVKWE